jgi:hypothetical protein
LAKHENKVLKFFLLINSEVQLEVKEKRSKEASAVHCLKKASSNYNFCIMDKDLFF